MIPATEPPAMPYKAISDLPDNVRDHVPKHAQEIYKKAFNNAWDEYGDKSTANRPSSLRHVPTVYLPRDSLQSVVGRTVSQVRLTPRIWGSIRATDQLSIWTSYNVPSRRSRARSISLAPRLISDCST